MVNVLLIFHLSDSIYRDCVVDSGNVRTLTMRKSYVKHVLYSIPILGEEVFIRKSARGHFFDGHHGNAEIHMRSYQV